MTLNLAERTHTMPTITDPRALASDWLAAQMTALDSAIRTGDGPAAVDVFQRLNANGLPTLTAELIGNVTHNAVALLRGRPFPIIRLSATATAELDQLGAALAGAPAEPIDPREPGDTGVYPAQGSDQQEEDTMKRDGQNTAQGAETADREVKPTDDALRDLAPGDTAHVSKDQETATVEHRGDQDDADGTGNKS